MTLTPFSQECCWVSQTLVKSIPQQRSQAAFAEQTIPGLARGYDFRIRSCENGSVGGSVCNISLFRISAAERADLELLDRKIIAAGAYRTVNRQTIGDHKRPDLFFRESAQGRVNTQNTAHTGFRRIKDLIDEFCFPSRGLKKASCRLLKNIQVRGARKIDERRRTYSTLQRGD
jgi:hypothetical protein